MFPRPPESYCRRVEKRTCEFHELNVFLSFQETCKLEFIVFKYVLQSCAEFLILTSNFRLPTSFFRKFHFRTVLMCCAQKSRSKVVSNCGLFVNMTFLENKDYILESYDSLPEYTYCNSPVLVEYNANASVGSLDFG